MTRVFVLVLVLLSAMMLASCNTGKNERARQIQEYENQLDQGSREVEANYDCFAETLRTKKDELCGVVVPTRGYRTIEPPELSGEEYIQALENKANEYTSAMNDYRIVADEYYSFLNKNEEQLLKDGVNVAQKKITLQQQRLAYQADADKLADALNDLMERERAQQDAIQNILKILMAVV